MLNFFKSIREKWENWSGDRELEHAIRRHLSANGHYGGTAKLQNVRLAAVQRPGWLQVYRFDVVARVIPVLTVKDIDENLDGDTDDHTGEDASDEVLENRPPEYSKLYGLVREDVRHDITTIRTFDNPEARRELFVHWSDNLIQLRSGRALS
jgi:hypothetical protein